MRHAQRGSRACKLADRLLSVAQNTQETELLLEAHHAQWSTAFWRGELAVAYAHATRGIALYDRQEHQSLAFRYDGHDPGVCCRDFGALALWLMGYADQALQRSQERWPSHESSRTPTRWRKP